MNASNGRRIGFNALYIVPGQVGGTEIAARELIRALAAERPQDELIVYLGRDGRDAFRKLGLPANVRLVSLGPPSSIRPLRLLVELLWLPVVARLQRIELLHSLGTTAPLWGKAVRVLTVHDIVFHHFPRTLSPLATRAMNWLVPRAVAHSVRVQTDSHATARDLVETYGSDETKMDVVHLGLGFKASSAPAPETQLRDKFALGDAPVILCVAQLVEHKNIPRLLEAFAEIVSDHASDGLAPELVLVGHEGREAAALTERAKQLGVSDKMRFTGWVEADELEGLYALADVFVYPTLFEGFGMPPLEAMARGVPVACSNATSLPEVVGDAAELFDPRDTSAIAAATKKLLGDRERANALVARGQERVKQFTWQATARAALASYERAFAQAGKSRPGK